MASDKENPRLTAFREYRNTKFIPMAGPLTDAERADLQAQTDLLNAPHPASEPAQPLDQCSRCQSPREYWQDAATLDGDSLGEAKNYCGLCGALLCNERTVSDDPPQRCYLWWGHKEAGNPTHRIGEWSTVAQPPSLPVSAAEGELPKIERYSLMSSLEGYTKIATGEFVLYTDHAAQLRAGLTERDQAHRLAAENFDLLREAKSQLSSATKLHDEELTRWQDAIYQALRKVCGDSIDGGGCDSGDPLDFTMAEVTQGLGILLERAEAAESQLSTLRQKVEDVLALPMPETISYPAHGSGMLAFHTPETITQFVKQIRAILAAK